MKHMLIAQSGGPSAAINATVAGVVERCMTSGQVAESMARAMESRE